MTLLILDVYPLQRWRAGWRRVLAEKLPYCALALAGAAVAAVWARSQGAAFTDYGSYGIAARIGLIAYSVSGEVPSQVSPPGPAFPEQALLAPGRADDAILPLARAVELSPSEPSFRLWLAHAYRGAGQVALADGEFAALRRLDPKAPASTAVR